MIELKGVRKSYGTNEILKGIDLQIADQDYLVILGASGSGKSTLLNILSGLEKLPELPILLFSSNGQGTGYSQEEWQSLQKDFAAQHPQTELILLDYPHYVHDYASDELSEKIKEFLK